MPNKDTYFVMKDGVAIQPVIPQDGLELYYDVKGKENTDNYKGTLLDMSGNGRHGTLSNFAYEGVSGFTGTTEGGLLLDDVDDKIVRPAISGIKYTSASRNILDEQKWLNAVNGASNGTFKKTSSSITLTSTGTDCYTSTYDGSNGAYIKVDPLTTYTLSFKKANNTAGRVYVFYYTDEQDIAYNDGTNNLNTSLTFTTPSDCNFIKFRLGIADAGFTEVFSNIQIEKANIATPYTPYIPLPIMTYQMNGNILSFEKDGTVKRTTKDANGNEVVVLRKGINLVRNGNFALGLSQFFSGNNGIWIGNGSYARYNIEDNYLRLNGDGLYLNPLTTYQSTTLLCPNKKVYFSIWYRSNNVGKSKLTKAVVELKDNFNANISIISSQNITDSDWHRVEGVGMNVSYDSYLSLRVYFNGFNDKSENIGYSWDIKEAQMIDLTEGYGAGNEPTLEYIKAHPEEFAWTPNPNDLIETVEIKNNLVGDLENLQGNDFEQHEDGVITYTDEAEQGSVVRVGIDGISDQPLRFRNATGEQVVITEHDQIDTDAIKKIEFQGNSVQLTDKYREVSGTSATIAPELHDKDVADKLVIGGNTTQYTESSNVVTDGLEMWLSGRNFSNSPATTVWKDLTGVNNGTASGFAYTSVSGSDGAGSIVFDGVDDGIIGSTSQTIYDYNSFTLEVKCIIDSTSVASSVILGNRYREGVTTSFLKLTPNMFEYYVDSVQHGILNTVNRNTLVHLTIVKDKNTLKYFTNGELTSSKTLSVGLTMPPMPFGIGKDPFNTSTPEPFKGKINFVRKYGRALTDAEVLQNYNAGLAIPIPNIAMPQEVKHVNSGNKVMVHGKNLVSQTVNWNSVGIYDNALLLKLSNLKPSTQYTLSFEGTVGNYYYTNEKLFNQISLWVFSGRTYVTVTTNPVISMTDGNQYVPNQGWRILKNYQNQSTPNTFVDVQMEEGPVATSFEPYSGLETTIPVTLRSIG